jgi:hypothetical protein
VADEYFLYGAGGTSGPSLKYGGAALTVGEFGVAPTDAIKTATGYDIAVKILGTDQLSFWATDNSGNYLSTIASHVSGTNATLQSLEAVFYQDFNGDGVIDTPATSIDVKGQVVLPLGSVIQPATIEAGATLELTGADSASVTFNGSTGTLILDHSSAFTAEIFKFAGNGNPSSSDQIDLRDINFVSGTTTESFTGTASGGTLTISDGHETASILLSGNYTQSTFELSSDGHGGTIVIDPPARQDHPPVDSFVFKDSAAGSHDVDSLAHASDPSADWHWANLHDHHFIIR